MEYRKLSDTEIVVLMQNGCTARDWNLVEVDALGEMPNLLRVHFWGSVRIGHACNIQDATIQDCTVGHHTSIAHVEKIVNYDIGDHCDISHSGWITATPGAAMGGGTAVSVMDETGGREISICQDLTAQVAYMATFYRHEPRLVAGLKALIDDWADRHKAPRGVIGDRVRITYTTAIENVNIGDGSLVSGAAKLHNGTLGRDTQVLENVSAADFIAADQAVIGTTCVAKHVFLGQAAKLGNGFVAHNSVIFSNCVLECGETDALFAGPHTVSFHRSTLLIATHISFFNAGSGTNQSNHYYCTGPVHHGIMERGCKTGSNSYVKWPARLGQFSVVMGHHSQHPDTHALPFSYLFGNNGRTTVLPAANLKTCGMLRDVLKWRKRDLRDPKYHKLDCTNYEEFTPYNVLAMMQGIDFLRDLQASPQKAANLRFTVCEGHVQEGIDLYTLAIRYFMGKAVAERLLARGMDGLMTTTDTTDVSHWVDMSGMVAPRAATDDICRRVVAGEFRTLDKLNAAIEQVHQAYDEYAWHFVLDNFQRVYGTKPAAVTPDQIRGVLTQWMADIRALGEQRERGAMKDFSAEMCIGFGIDHPEMAQSDYQAVRGVPGDNPHIHTIRDHYTTALSVAEQALARVGE